MRLPEGAARELIDQAQREMTVRGWNPRGEFAQGTRIAVDNARRQVLTEQRRHTLAARESPSPLSTESPSPDAHQVA